MPPSGVLCPGNWILSTNTDMVFVPKRGQGLADLAKDLEGDAYGLPRFEIPEWLWESVPRNDPRRMMDLLDEWSGSIGLDEVTLGHDWILYDAPGDFQLIRRSLVDEIHGFDEEMIHGWHVDSNFWKRVHNRLGSIGSVHPDLAGYHTNHNRTLTRWTSDSSGGNDLTRFVYGVGHSALPEQADTWGLAQFDIPEIRLTRANPVQMLEAAAARSAGQNAQPIISDSREQRTVLDYDARHVLPFMLDPIISSHPRPSVGYAGINASTRDMLTHSLARLSPPATLMTGDAALDDAELLIVDLGVDMSTGRGPITPDEADEFIGLQEKIPDALGRRPTPPDVLLINGISGVWSTWVREHFHVLYGTYHGRVQGAVPRAEQNDTASGADQARMLRFIARRPHPRPLIATTPSTWLLDLADPSSITCLGPGWESVDRDGALLGGDQAALTFTGRAGGSAGLHAVVELTSWPPESGVVPEPVNLRVEVGGAVLLDESVTPRGRQTAFHTTCPSLTGGEHTLVMTVTTATGEPYDPRLTGGVHPWIRLEGLRLHDLQMAEGSNPTGVLTPVGTNAEGETALAGWWARSDEEGVWAVARGGALVVAPDPPVSDLALLLLGHPERPAQRIAIAARGDGETRTEATISSQRTQVITVELPPPAVGHPTTVTFEEIGQAAPTGEIAQLWSFGPSRNDYGVGDRLVFQSGSADTSVLQTGWHSPESGGVWMAATEAEIRFRPRAPLRTGTTLLIEGGLFHPASQALEATVNDRRAKVRLRRRRSRIEIVMPADMEGGEVLRLRLFVSPLVSPAQLGGSTDERELGAVITALVIDPRRSG
jgi:hypothetical protein